MMGFALIVAAGLPAFAVGDATITVLPERFSGAVPNAHYHAGRAPLASKPLVSLPPGAVAARGWLLEQLERQAAGLTRDLETVDESVALDSAWLGGDGDSWERGPYYVRGLLELAYVLGDQALIGQSAKWVEWVLSSQDADGYFGPAVEKENYDWWPNMVVLDYLRSYHAATGDGRVIDVMRNYLAYQAREIDAHRLQSWARVRGGDNLDSIYWLYDRTGETWLLDLGDKLDAQTFNYTYHYRLPGVWDQTMHVVDLAMSFKQPVVRYRRTLEPVRIEAVEDGWRKTMEGQGRVDGMFSGDERMMDRRGKRGVEFCAIVECLYSHELLLGYTGYGRYADRLERIAYNALPAILNRDLSGFQYYSQQNQVMCTLGSHQFSTDHKDDLTFGPQTGWPCCRFNWHFGWPRLVAHLWLATDDDGLAAPVYGPCRVTARVAGGDEVTIVEETDYPFAEAVCFTVEATAPVVFPLVLHVPNWCTDAALAVNGVTAECGPAGSFVRIDRTWAGGDRVDLVLPMPLRTSTGYRNSVVVERGPLVFALAVGEEWRLIEGKSDPRYPSYEVLPTTPWNYGLVVNRDAPAEAFALQRRPMPEQPWDPARTPLVLHGTGCRVSDWYLEINNTSHIPESPLRASAPTEPVTLLPYGATALRIGFFPQVLPSATLRLW